MIRGWVMVISDDHSFVGIFVSVASYERNSLNKLSNDWLGAIAIRLYLYFKRYSNRYL